MPSLSKSLFLPVLLLLAALLLATARPAAAAMPDTPWSGSGTGTTKVVADGTSADPDFDYNSVGPYSGAWTYQATAGATRAVPIKWEYSGFHAWFEVTVGLTAFVQRSGAEVVTQALEKAGPTDCCSTPSGGFDYSGTTTFNVQKGDVYGFRMTGSNFDSNPTLQGALKLHAVDSTPPVVTPVVTGTLGANGFYTGTATVKWTVQDAESPISASTGCADATVDEDTAGKTITCSATSAGGTTTKSVTIKRDTTPPVVNVPPVMVAQATGANGAVVSYTAAATDNLDPSPKLACTQGSGTQFPVGTTHVACTATDAAGLSASKSFDVAVYPAAAPPAQPTQPTQPVHPAAQLKRINALLVFRFTIAHHKTKLASLEVRNVPTGATVDVTCTGKSCPKPLRRGLVMQAQGSHVSLSALVHTTFAGGTTIRVTISRPGSITAVKTLTLRNGTAPTVGTRCQAPGSAKIVAC